MYFHEWLDEQTVVQGGIKPVYPTTSWPDSNKSAAAMIDGDDGWRFYHGTYTAAGRQFDLKLSRHSSSPKTIHVDGLSSQGVAAVGLKEIVPLLMADLGKIGVTDVQWRAATSNFGRQGAAANRERTPEREAAIRNRLFGRMTKQHVSQNT